MMPEKSFDEIETLWEAADPETKQDYLFLALRHVNKTVEERNSLCVCRLRECSDALTIRAAGYEKKFVTKKQAHVFGFIALVCIVAFAVGSGMISFKEAISMIKP